MTGLLVVNGFLKGNKYDELHDMLMSEFSKHGVDLKLVTNIQLNSFIGEYKCLKEDFALFWDKDILLAKRLENMGIKVFNSASAISLCDDKGATAVLLENSDIIMPKTFIAPFTYQNIGYKDYGFLEGVAAALGFPLVVKESFGSFGQQVYLAKNKTELMNICAYIGSKPFIIQEFIKSSEGVDARLEVIGGKVVAAVKRTAQKGEFRSNATLGGNMEKFDPPKSFCDMAIKVAKLTGVDFAGVDLLFGEKGEPIFCEINSNAHIKNLYLATGYNAAGDLAEYILGKL